ncbi:MAG TPA: SagB family peptide dehydrogenase [Methylomirabilota bacterium]|jgi:SagB-type dehydrogenase family enzyme|nr:SagB family peptide dehydrogenase [Methylomirabilota bacterium]
MTTNRDVAAAWSYHNGTKHSLESIRRNPHFLDWDNQPLAFKIYRDVESVPLPQEWPAVQTSTLQAIATLPAVPQQEMIPDLSRLAALLYLSAGITKRRTYPGGEIYFRAAACTGALYHIDLYLVCGDLPELPAGVYHFGPHDFALHRLRSGDFRGVLVHASGEEAAITHAPVTVVCTSTYWRNAWKYQARTYRHCFWDAGTLLANFLATASALSTPTRIVAGFVDSEVNCLLDLDDEREVALALAPVGFSRSAAPETAPTVAPLHLQTAPLSKTEIDYPTIRAMHAASSLHTAEEVRAWRGAGTPHREPEPQGRLFPLRETPAAQLPPAPLEDIIRHRGSTRQFARVAISFAQLSTLLLGVTKGAPTDFLSSPAASLTDLYLIVHAVDGLPSGAYVYHRDRQALELLREGNFRKEAGYLGLGQQLPADAGVDIFCLTTLSAVLEQLGNRGYRAAQLEAAIIGGKCYLAAYGQGLGATGLTFFDDDVTAFFSPHAAGKSVMFLTAIGKSMKRKVLRAES